MGVSETLNRDELKTLVDDANRRLTNRYANKVISGRPGAAPRFELYHCSLSLCSHKVRTVLAEKGVPYISHAMTIMPAGRMIPQNYRPEYVRLRLKGFRNPKFVNGYNGASSVETQGFDPCVVPTLVDHRDCRVVVDSKEICEYIDANADEGEKLIPGELAEEIERQTELVDRAAHVALLYGAHPDDDRRPDRFAGAIEGVHARKIRALTAVLAHIGPDNALRAAYDAKVAKESAAGEFVIDAEAMRDAHRQAAAHVRDLETQLATHDGNWVFGDRYTLADILWTVSLYRLKWLGLERFWDSDSGNARVAEYAERAIRRPSFRAGVSNWKYSHGPSPHVEELSGGGAKLGFAIHMMREGSVLESMFGSDIPLPKQ